MKTGEEIINNILDDRYGNHKTYHRGEYITDSKDGVVYVVGELIEDVKKAIASTRKAEREKILEMFWDWVEDLPLKDMPLTKDKKLQLTDIHEVNLEDFHKFEKEVLK